MFIRLIIYIVRCCLAAPYSVMRRYFLVLVGHTSLPCWALKYSIFVLLVESVEFAGLSDLKRSTKTFARVQNIELWLFQLRDL